MLRPTDSRLMESWVRTHHRATGGASRPDAVSRAPRRGHAAAGLVAAILFAASPASAVIIKLGDGTGNTEAEPPLDDPGIEYVGNFGYESGVYLGNGWVISAYHIEFQPFSLGAVTYPDVPGSRHRLTTPGVGLADLAVFKIDGDPGLAPMNVATLSAPPNASVIMYGHGRDRGADVSFDDVNGWAWGGAHSFRWGTNRISGVNQTVLDTRVFLTTFDESGSGVGVAEAQAAVGDSGGAVFYKRSGSWELTGIMFATGLNSPSQPTNYALFGNTTVSADLSVYRSEILSVIGQPTCDDGLDEDGDGLTDYPADPGCDSASDDDERNPNVACDDGLDDDGDGLTDWPADPGCSDANDGSETSPGLVCDDGTDNDGDGLTDWPTDPGCDDGLDASEQSPGLACDDGADNDGDGLTDWPADPGCDDSSDPSEQSPSIECDNGADDDGDGLTDWPADPGCDGAGDPSEHSPALVCDNGVDDDGDGLTDWPTDPGCDDQSDPSELSPSVACDDGSDNDGDGLTDWPADPGCDDASDASELAPGVACDNGSDDDGDGLTDWPADPGCDDGSDTSELAPGVACDDGSDNDGDLLVDYPDDPECSGPTDASEAPDVLVPVTSGLGAGVIAMWLGWTGRTRLGAGGERGLNRRRGA